MIIIAGAGALFLWTVDRNLSALILFVVLHFFLFCNLFRVKRTPELVWTGILLLNTALLVFVFGRQWGVVMVIQLPVTAFLLWQETRRPYYHGIGCRRWNSDYIDAYMSGEILPEKRRQDRGAE